MIVFREGGRTKIVCPKKNGEKNKIWRIGFRCWKNAKDLLGKSKNIAMHIADQNDDGKLDLKDVSVIAETVGNYSKKGNTGSEGN